jgi:hypothetical protein
VDGCRQVKRLLDQVITENGLKMIREGAVDKSDTMMMDLEG